MTADKVITGFSKLSKRGKIKWIVENFFKDPEAVMRELMSYWHDNEDQQKVLDGFSENTISNFFMPYGVAPNFLINGRTYCVPMVTEESSVVAAASHAAKFWMPRGGFQTKILGTEKIGQIHFLWDGNAADLQHRFQIMRETLIQSVAEPNSRMAARGGGLLDIELKDLTEKLPHYYQLFASFETCDSMGANFINTLLEAIAKNFKWMCGQDDLLRSSAEPEIIMSILSNFTPNCLVRAEVSCPVHELNEASPNCSGDEFARRFKLAVDMAHVDCYRATTHNKGIFNGIDAVILATGNDFRAIEAGGHTYAAKEGRYQSLSHCTIDKDVFRFWLDIPLAIGTVGGLTSLHPMAKRSLELLGNPSAPELMQVVAATGLAQNFAALKSLTTTGIQKGHMKMHLLNILNHLGATENEVKEAMVYFKDQIVSHHAVREFLELFRNKNQ